MAKTVYDSWQDEAASPQGGTFLERALERALGRLEGDSSLTEAERAAAKAALAAALTAEIRDVLGARPLRRGKAIAPLANPPPARPFALQAEADKPGYFRAPSAVVGVCEATGADVRLTGGTATWLRVAPVWDPGRSWSFEEVEAALGGAVLPIFADAGRVGRFAAAEGVGTFAISPSETESSGVVFCFRSGEVWAVDSYVQDALAEQRPHRAIHTFEPQLTAAFETYVGLLQRLGVAGPYRWVVGMDGLAGRSMALPQEGEAGDMALRGDCLLNTVQVAGEYEAGAPFETALAPFFDELRKACSTPVG
ncbi:MAG TPA: hypothetical protein VGC92_16070 [Phenylobacterium sp.]